MNEQPTATMYYNGHTILQFGTWYCVKGREALKFSTLEAAKENIDWMQGKRSRINPFQQSKSEKP